MKTALIGYTGLLLASTGTLAAPTVNGNLISWPDDGWYQVQSVTQSGITEVCQGGQSCEVTQGEYIVINLTTGERFNDIFVTGAESTDQITVVGNTISWPDNGWYQVQEAQTYAEICSGTRSCEVEAGTYRVINHTTGERFEGIEVGDSSEPAPAITVTGNVISWPDDGWYQVQDATTFISSCGGEQSCEVTPGTYIVINHTSGERFENILVEDDDRLPSDTDPDPVTTAITTDNHIELLSNVFAAYSGKLYGDDILTAPDFTDPSFEFWPDFSFETNELISQPIDIVCSNGGTAALVPETEGTDYPLYWNFDFDNCQDGSTILDGQISRGIYEAILISSTGYSRDDQTEVLEFSGDLNGRSLRHWYTDDLNFSLKTTTSSLIIEDSTSGFSLDPVVLTAGFDIQADWTGNQRITVLVPEFFNPENDEGELQMSAGPDNTLVLDANTGDADTVSITISADGVDSTFTQPWSLWSDSFLFESESGY